MMHRKRRITQSYLKFACRQYAPLIQRLAFRIGNDASQVEELKSIAIEELLACMICYDNTGSFMTFIYGRLTNVFRHLRDYENRLKRVKVIPIGTMIQIAEQCRDMDASMIIEECLECLDDKEKEIIKALFFDSKTMRDIHSDCGIVPSTVCHIKTRALNKMRKYCGVSYD